MQNHLFEDIAETIEPIWTLRQICQMTKAGQVMTVCVLAKNSQPSDECGYRRRSDTRERELVEDRLKALSLSAPLVGILWTPIGILRSTDQNSAGRAIKHGKLRRDRSPRAN